MWQSRWHALQIMEYTAYHTNGYELSGSCGPQSESSYIDRTFGVTRI